MPGDNTFQGRTATTWTSVSVTGIDVPFITLVTSKTNIQSDPVPWSNLQGAGLGDAIFTSSSQDTDWAYFNYNFANVPPSAQTRMQFSYDFSPRVENGPDGYLHLNFWNSVFFSTVNGGLLELEVIVNGEWILDSGNTGGLSRTLEYNTPALPWNIAEDFVYHPDTNQTRFYASRVSTGTGVGEGLAIRGYLIGAPIPSSGVLVVAGVGSAFALRTRRVIGIRSKQRH